MYLVYQILFMEQRILKKIAFYATIIVSATIRKIEIV